MSRRKLLAVFIVLTMVLSMFGPSFAGTQTHFGYENRLTVGLDYVFDFMLPNYWSDDEIDQVNNFIFQPLLRQNIEGQWVPEAATEYSASDTRDRITFKLNPENKFHDGTPVTADDVVFTYMLYADPSHPTNHNSVYYLEGYFDFRSGNLTPDPSEDLADYFPGVVAIDDYTVEFNFREGNRRNIEYTTLGIMPAHYYGEYYSYGDFDLPYDLASRPVGSGPYQFEEFQEYNEILLTRSPYYLYENDFPIHELLFIEADSSEQIEYFKSNDLDLFTSAYFEVYPKDLDIENNPNRTFNEYPRSGYGYVKTNHEHGPTADPAVRKALYYAFDEAAFNESFLKGYGHPQYHPFSPYSWAVDEEWLKELPDYSYDLEKAKNILDDAGWTVGNSGYREKNGEVLSLTILSMPDHEILDTLIPIWEKEWGVGLSIELNILYEEFNSLLEMIIYESDDYVEEWSVFFLATTIHSYDPHGTLEGSFHSRYIRNGGNNTSRYRNAEVDRLIDKAEGIIEISDARPIYQQIGKLLMEDAVFMPVYVNSGFDYYHSKLKNLETHALYNWTKGIRTAYIEGHPPFDEALNEYRISEPGGNRYSTAETIAKELYETSDTVIIVRGDGAGNAPNVVDALSASGLAGAHEAPILLTHPTRLLDDTKDAINNLKAKEAIIVGGDGAVSPAVESAIESLGLSTRRIRVEGGDRFSTASEVAYEVMQKNPVNTAIIAGGTALVDSLVAGPVAHEYGYPILLVGRNTPAPTEEFLKTQGIENLIIVGGIGVVSESVENQLKSMVPGAVNRVSGGNRFETSIAVAEEFFSDHDHVVLVNGISFVDAVPASILGEPLLYIRQDRIPDNIKAVLAEKSGVRVVGGPGAISNEVLMEAYQIVKN